MNNKRKQWGVVVAGLSEVGKLGISSHWENYWRGWWKDEGGGPRSNPHTTTMLFFTRQEAQLKADEYIDQVKAWHYEPKKFNPHKEKT
jgi:hypothetical protein